jgi:transposase
MEATNYYHYCLAHFLCKQGVLVSVVNRLSVKRFIQNEVGKSKNR